VASTCFKRLQLVAPCDPPLPKDLTTDVLNERLDRIYAALKVARTRDLSTVTPRVAERSGVREISVVFGAGRTQAELSNILNGLIATIASMKDHARGVFKARGIDPAKAEAIAEQSANTIIRDLFDLDKHGPRRPGEKGHSGLNPRLGEAQAFLRLDGAGVKIGSRVEKVGPGSAELVVDADVLAEDGSRIGGLLDICDDAIRAWENGLASFGLFTPADRQ
jgi:hypothetical protein